MQIPVNKISLASALSALGKLVSRTSLIKAYQGIEIEGKANTLFFRTRNVTEKMEFRIITDLEDDFPATLVEFEQFRLAVRNCKNKTLKLEIDNGEVFIEGVKLAPVDGRFPIPEIIPDQDVCVTELPADTLSALEKLAPIADKGKDIRKVLSGINISGDGFTAANGKELSNIPFPLEKTGSVTIPFPLALLATKAFGEAGRLTTWQKDEDTHFELSLGAWTWRAKAFKEHYPNWKRVVPERTDKTHYVSFQQDRAEMFRRYLRGVPDDPRKPTTIKLSRLTEVPDNLHLESSNGILFSILAEFDPNWGDLSFIVRKEILAHLLNEGHTRIEINDALSPFVGTGGMGQFVAMPVYVKKPQAQTEQSAEQVAVQTEPVEAQPIPESADSAAEKIPSHEPENEIPANPNTTQNKEPQTMNENPTIIHTVSAPVQTSAQNNEPANPLDELTANIEAMKGKLKTMFDESAALARKVREVALVQRQKEREYQQARRTLERVRVATGAVTYKPEEDYWFWDKRGCDMLEVALADWPDDYTVKTVAEAFSVDVPGLSKPLVGEFDLVTMDGGDETICDWKTAAMKWPAGKADRDLQATVFCYAFQQKYGINPLFRFDVYTKAKTPAHHQFYTLRSNDDFERFVYLAGKIEQAVNTGIFLPVESCMNCAECAYGSRCKAVHRKAA